MVGPATFVILLLVGLLLVFGALLLSNVRRPAPGAPPQPSRRSCPGCGQTNVPAAGFCAHCGTALRLER
jgi:hypothetical protein